MISNLFLAIGLVGSVGLASLPSNNNSFFDTFYTGSISRTENIETILGNTPVNFHGYVGLEDLATDYVTNDQVYWVYTTSGWEHLDVNDSNPYEPDWLPTLVIDYSTEYWGRVVFGMYVQYLQVTPSVVSVNIQMAYPYYYFSYLDFGYNNTLVFGYTCPNSNGNVYVNSTRCDVDFQYTSIYTPPVNFGVTNEDNDQYSVVYTPFVYHASYSNRGTDDVTLFFATACYQQTETDRYNEGFNDGYTQGHEVGYDEGQTTGYHNGYIDGQNAGIAISQNGDFLSLFASLADTPIRMLYSLFNFELFGTSMIIVVLSLITVIIVIKIVRKFL